MGSARAAVAVLCAGCAGSPRVAPRAIEARAIEARADDRALTPIGGAARTQPSAAPAMESTDSPASPQATRARASASQPRAAALAAPWSCRALGEPLRLPPPALAVPPGEAGYVHDASVGLLTVAERRPDARAARLELRASWRAAEEPRTGTSHSARFAMALPFHGPESARWTLLDAGTREALALRCDPLAAPTAARCALIELRAGGGTLRAHAPDGAPWYARDGATQVVLIAHAAASPGASSPAEARATLLILRAGEAGVQRAEVRLDAEHTGATPFALGDDAGSLGYAPDGALTLVPVGGPARPLGAHESYDACLSDARGELLVPATGTLRGDDGGTRELALRVRFGVAGDALCVRGVNGTATELGGEGWLRLSPEGSEFTGVARLRHGILRVSCRPPPVRARGE